MRPRLTLHIGTVPAAVSEAAFQACNKLWTGGVAPFVHVVPTARLARLFRRRRPGYPALTWWQLVERWARRAELRRAYIDEEQIFHIFEQLLGDRTRYAGIFYGRGQEGPSPALVSLLTELVRRTKEHEVGPREAAAFCPRAERRRAIENLLRDYQAYTSEHLLMDQVDRERILAELLEGGEDGFLGTIRWIAIDGFLGPTPVQWRLLRALRSRIDTLVFLAEPEGGGPQARIVSEDISRWRSLMPESESRLPAESSLSTRAFFCGEAGEPDARVRIIVAQDREVEVAAIAARIKEMALAGEEGFDFSRVAVTFMNLGQYAPIVRDVFPRFGLLFSISLGDPLIATTTGATVRAILDAVASSYSREAVLRLLSSPFVAWYDETGARIWPEEVERFSRRAGVYEGIGEWEARFRWLVEHKVEDQVPEGKKTGGGWEGSEGEPPGEESRIEVVGRAMNSLFAELERLNKRQKLSEHVGVLRDLLFRLHVLRRVVVRGLEQLPPDDMERETRALAAFQRYLDTLLFEAETRGDIPMTPAEFARRVERGLTIHQFEPSDVKPRCVQVMGALETRSHPFDILFIGGLAEGVFPRAPRANPLFCTSGGTLPWEKPLPFEEDSYHFCGALANTRERVWLSYPMFDEKGAPLIPSLFIEECRRIFIPEEDLIQEEPVLTVRAYQCRIGEDIKAGKERRERALEALQAISSNPELPWAGGMARAMEVETARCAGVEQPFTTHIRAPDLASQLQADYGPEYQFSPTELELYGQCPFHYFAERVLRLVPLKEEEPDQDPAERGRIIHRILRRFYKEKVPLEFVSPGSIAQELERIRRIAREEYENACPEDALVEWNRTRLIGSREITGILQQFLRFEMQLGMEEKGYGGHPLELEWEFRGVGLNAPEEPVVVIQGRIDRMDLFDGRFAYILDYKTGTPPRVSEGCELGTHLQLPLYILAARALRKEPIAGAAFLELRPGKVEVPSDGHLTDPGAGRTFYGKRRATDEFGNILEKARKDAITYTGGIRNGEFPVTSHDGKDAHCPRCHFLSACRSATSKFGGY